MTDAVVDDATRPVLVTVPNVPVLTVGSWPGLFGVFTCTSDDLYAAVAAFDDPGYSKPYLKIGHCDTRFNTAGPCEPPEDGQPAIGRLINPRVTDDGMTLVVDIAGVPAWIADIMATAWPGRSIEGQAHYKTQTGIVHRFALTALSLLGVEMPAVSTLADIATIFGLDPVAVAASAADSLTEESMPDPIAVAASVNLDTVRQQYYADSNADVRRELGGSWSWIREVYTDFVVVDDDEGHLFRLPWTESTDRPGEVVFGVATQVRVEYVDQPVAASSPPQVSDALRRGGLRARLAAMGAEPGATEQPAASEPVITPPVVEPVPEAAPESVEPVSQPHTPDVPAAEPEQPTEMKGDDMSLSEFRSRLGLPDDADEASILAAFDERIKPTAEPPSVVEAPAEPVAASTRPALPEGVVVIDEATLNELRRNATLGAQAAERQRVSDRDRFIGDAVAAGKIAPARQDHWVKSWEADPDGTKTVLASLEAGLVVPVVMAGATGNGDEPVDALGASDDAVADWANQLGIDVKELTRG